MTIGKNWIRDTAEAIAQQWTFGPGPNHYITNEQRQTIADDLQTIIQKHCPFKFDVAYQEVGQLLPESLGLFERECLEFIQSIPLDDPLGDFFTRQFAEKALKLVREYGDYREKAALAARDYAAYKEQSVLIGKPTLICAACGNTTSLAAVWARTFLNPGRCGCGGYFKVFRE